MFTASITAHGRHPTFKTIEFNRRDSRQQDIILQSKRTRLVKPTIPFNLSSNLRQFSKAHQQIHKKKKNAVTKNHLEKEDAQSEKSIVVVIFALGLAVALLDGAGDDDAGVEKALDVGDVVVLGHVDPPRRPQKEVEPAPHYPQSDPPPPPLLSPPPLQNLPN